MRIFTFALLIALTSAFHVSMTPSLNSFGLQRGSSISTKVGCRYLAGRAGRFSLRAQASIDDPKSEDSSALESPTVLSDEDLDARIAAAGLDRIDTSIKEAENLTPIQQAMKTSAGLGKTAIATAANSAISVLNQLEKPIAEEDWEKIAPKEVKEESTSMLSSGGGLVALPVFIIGGMLGYWALASEFNWF